MSSKSSLRAFFAMGALSVGCAAALGCVADRPSRNGVACAVGTDEFWTQDRR